MTRVMVTYLRMLVTIAVSRAKDFLSHANGRLRGVLSKANGLPDGGGRGG